MKAFSAASPGGLATGKAFLHLVAHFLREILAAGPGSRRPRGPCVLDSTAPGGLAPRSQKEHSVISISPALAWSIAAAAVLGAELLLSTTYLLAVALGLAVTAVAAWAGLSFSWQLFVCALAVAAGCVGVLLWRRRHAGAPDPSARLQNLDEGRCVRVASAGSDGLAVVQYRGATWIARPQGAAPLTPGRWTIARVDGAQLVLDRRVSD